MNKNSRKKILQRIEKEAQAQALVSRLNPPSPSQSGQEYAAQVYNQLLDMMLGSDDAGFADDQDADDNESEDPKE
jgi:hypothetical protein